MRNHRDAGHGKDHTSATFALAFDLWGFGAFTFFGFGALIARRRRRRNITSATAVQIGRLVIEIVEKSFFV
jgi:hypothetical protein